MNLMRKAIAALAAALMLGAVLTCVSAVPSLEPDTKGSLKVTILEKGKDDVFVPGGEISLYRIATVRADEGKWEYALTPSFAATGVVLDKLDTMTGEQHKAMVATLQDHIAKQKLEPLAKLVPDVLHGTVQFKSLDLGLYLVVQTKPGIRHYAIQPFLVTVPQLDGETYVYDVDAAPKIGEGAPPTTTPPATTKPSGGKLPQTGQLWWPVYALFGAGVVCYTTGWAMKRRHTDD